MIQSMDESVGRVVETVEQNGLTERTIVIFTSDNGGLLQSTSNLPLRAGKGSTYEGGVRVPLVIRWPGVTEADSACHEPVMSIDLFPTLLELTQASPEARDAVDGHSLMPLLRDPSVQLTRNELYWHYPHYHPGGATPYGAVRARDWKLVEFYEDNRIELYHLSDDLGETKDLAKVEPERAAALRARLHHWREEVGAQMPTPNPNYDPKKLPELPRAKRPRQAAAAARAS
jgi:arylsulfatase A-like enzyme